MSDDDIKKLYIEWRSLPVNIKCQDIVFISKYSRQGITASRLHAILKNPEIEQELNSREVTDMELSTFLGLLTRLCYEKAFKEKVPIKSLEGLTNAIVNLMKQRALEQGKPTERFDIDLKDKSPEEIHDLLISRLRRSDVN